MPETADVPAPVVVSLLRAGIDTRAARLYKEGRSEMPGPPTPAQIAAAIEPARAKQVDMLRRAVDGARMALDRAAAEGMALLSFGDDDYPARLGQLPDPPVVLWTRGNRALLGRPAVAIVGSRRASASSLLLAHGLGRDLARAGLVIVSGLALGVDAAAHEGALEAGGATVAVLGAGLDVVYPRRNTGLHSRIGQVGCLIAELAPGTPPLARHFPLRNRIISGLSVAVVVVEATERSGSLITARLALEQGRDVLAVPGSAVSGCHRGCHALIKDGAGLVEGAEDVLAAIGWRASRREPAPAAAGILGAMRPGAPMSLDELAALTGRRPADLLGELGTLEVAGLVGRFSGGLFVRLD